MCALEGYTQRHKQPSLKIMLETEHSADLAFDHSMQAVKDIKSSVLLTAYGLEANCGCDNSRNLGPSLIDRPLGSFTDNLNDQMEIKGFAHVRDSEEFSGVINQAGNYFDGLHGSETPDQVLGFSSATGNGPDDVQSSMKSEQDLLDFLNRSPSSQIQRSGSKGTSSFSGVSLSGIDSVTGIANHEGSSESDLWGRIEFLKDHESSGSPVASDDDFTASDGIDVIQDMMTTCALSPAPPLLKGFCAAFGVILEMTEEYIDNRQSTETSGEPDPQVNQSCDPSSQSCPERSCPTDPDDENGIYTGPRNNPIDLSQGDVGQGNPEDGSFGPDLTVPWHSYGSNRPTLLDITGQPSERDVSNQTSERRAFTINPVINPIPDGV